MVSETAARAAISRVVKAYDVRGIVPSEMDDAIAFALGEAFVDVVVRVPGDTPRVVVARDMRESGVSLADSFLRGAQGAGAQVVDAGECSTDELYFASGYLDAAGAMFTASHNPATYNGVKLCRPGARPVGADSGLPEIAERAAEVYERMLGAGRDDRERPGSWERVDLLRPYAQRLRELVPTPHARPLRVVVDAGNGMAGLTVPAVFGTEAGLPALPFEVLPMYFDLDGSFPHHEANPILPANTAALQAEVVRAGADAGLAFDGDADRCFVIDEQGHRVDPSVITALIGLRESRRAAVKGATPVVLYNAITSRAVPELLEKQGVRAVRTRVGHSFIKALMASEDAVFGGEHSGHYYFRDFFGADSGMLAALHVLSVLSADHRPLSEMLGSLDPYVRSGEIDVAVPSISRAQASVHRALGDGAEPVDVDDLDGLTISRWNGEPRWWVNVRPSNTESLLRVNVEATDEETMQRTRDLVLEALLK